MAADERDRAGDQAHERMQAEQPGDRHAQRVLQDEERHQRHQEPHQPRPAQGELAQVGGEADAGEEQEQEIGAHRILELEAQPARAQEDGGKDGEQDPTHDRARDAVALEDADTPADEGAEQQDEAGGKERVERVEADHIGR